MALNTVEDAVKAVEKVVAERGEDYVYLAPKPAYWLADGEEDEYDPKDGECMYRNPDGTASCIVGKIVLAEYGEKTFERLEEGSSVYGQSFLTEDMSPDVVEILTVAQAAQDSRRKYGEVLAEVKEQAAKLAEDRKAVEVGA